MEALNYPGVGNKLWSGMVECGKIARLKVEASGTRRNAMRIL